MASTTTYQERSLRQSGPSRRCSADLLTLLLDTARPRPLPIRKNSPPKGFHLPPYPRVKKTSSSRRSTKTPASRLAAAHDAALSTLSKIARPLPRRSTKNWFFQRRRETEVAPGRAQTREPAPGTQTAAAGWASALPPTRPLPTTTTPHSIRLRGKWKGDSSAPEYYLFLFFVETF